MTTVHKMTTKQAIEKVGEFVPQKDQRFTARLRGTGMEARFSPFTCLALSRTRCEAVDVMHNQRIFEYKTWQMREAAQIVNSEMNRREFIASAIALATAGPQMLEAASRAGSSTIAESVNAAGAEKIMSHAPCLFIDGTEVGRIASLSPQYAIPISIMSDAPPRMLSLNVPCKVQGFDLEIVRVANGVSQYKYLADKQCCQDVQVVIQYRIGPFFRGTCFLNTISRLDPYYSTLHVELKVATHRKENQAPAANE